MNPSKNRSSQRTPAVAGKFYPENSVELEKKIACHLVDLSKNKQKAIGVVSPHAGFIYSLMMSRVRCILESRYQKQ